MEWRAKYTRYYKTVPDTVCSKATLLSGDTERRIRVTQALE